LWVQVGKILTNVNLVVADIVDPVILGIDFLDLNNTIIDFSNYYLTIANEKIKADTLSSDNDQELNIYHLKLKKEIVVPPSSMKLATLYLQNYNNVLGNLVIQHDQHLNGLITPNIPQQGEPKMYVLLCNYTDTFLSLKKSHHFGIGLEVEIRLWMLM